VQTDAALRVRSVRVYWDRDADATLDTTGLAAQRDVRLGNASYNKTTNTWVLKVASKRLPIGQQWVLAQVVDTSGFVSEPRSVLLEVV
jgi:hypothetical protein